MSQNQRKREPDFTESATQILEGMTQGKYVELVMAAGQWMHVLRGDGKEAMARRCQRSESGAVTEYAKVATARNKPQMAEAVKVLARMMGTSKDAPREQQEIFGKVALELLGILVQQDSRAFAASR
ncbi:MAG: hypothetical protein MHM6MM_006302 [Cercozoa sp. M6MM]